MALMSLGHGFRRLVLPQRDNRLERVACDGTSPPLYAPCLAGFADTLADHTAPFAGLTARHDVLALVVRSVVSPPARAGRFHLGPTTRAAGRRDMSPSHSVPPKMGSRVWLASAFQA